MIATYNSNEGETPIHYASRSLHSHSLQHLLMDVASHHQQADHASLGQDLGSHAPLHAICHLALVLHTSWQGIWHICEKKAQRHNLRTNVSMAILFS